MASTTLLNPPSPPVADVEDNECIPEHCFHAFDTLYCELTGAEPIEPEFPDEKYPLFVTWNTRPARSGGDTRLRGCIGNFEPMPVREGIAEYAIVSAFKDSRFRRIEERELPRLECGISLLTNFEDASSYLDWTLGVHGIYISFPHPSLLPQSASSSNAPSPLSSSSFLPSTRVSRRLLTATYLPDVAPEQGWTKVEAVDSAIHKAGWNGKISEDIRRSIKLRRYQSRKCVVSWDDYTQWREQKGGKIL